MIRRAAFCLWLVSATLVGIGCASPAAPVAERQVPDAIPNAKEAAVAAHWRVVRVIDGDTIEVLQDRRTERVRLEGIDCPESGQAFGTRAKQFTSELVFGKNVGLIDKGRDRYGRLLAEVLLPDGANINRAIVKAGFAWHFKKYSSDEVLARLEVDTPAPVSLACLHLSAADQPRPH